MQTQLTTRHEYMPNLIDILAMLEDARYRLSKDPLVVARVEGYLVTYDEIRYFLRIDPTEEVRTYLGRHLRRFDQGKWYQT